MAEACNIDIKKAVSILSSCPDDNEQLLFFNANTPDGVALRSWGTVKQCLLDYITCKLFGFGWIKVPGSAFDGSGRYFQAGLVQSFNVFDDGIPNVLDRPTEWNYILDGGGNVIGLQVFVGIDPVNDNFYIIPNPIGCL